MSESQDKSNSQLTEAKQFFEKMSKKFCPLSAGSFNALKCARIGSAYDQLVASSLTKGEFDELQQAINQCVLLRKNTQRNLTWFQSLLIHKFRSVFGDSEIPKIGMWRQIIVQEFCDLTDEPQPTQSLSWMQLLPTSRVISSFAGPKEDLEKPLSLSFMLKGAYGDAGEMYEGFYTLKHPFDVLFSIMIMKSDLKDPKYERFMTFVRVLSIDSNDDDESPFTCIRFSAAALNSYQCSWQNELVAVIDLD